MKHRLQTLLKHKLQWLVLLTVQLFVCIEAEAFVVRFYSESSWSSVNAWMWPSGGDGSNKSFTKIGNNWWQYNETTITGDYYVIFRQDNNWNNDNPRSNGDGDKLSGAVHRKCSTGNAHTAVTGTNYFYIKRQKSSTSDDWGWVKLTKSGSTWSSSACVWYGIGSVDYQYSESTPSNDALSVNTSTITNKSNITSGSTVIFKISDTTVGVSVEYATAEVKYAVGNVAGGNVKVTYTNATGTSTTSSATTSTSLQTVNAAYSKNVTFTATKSSGYKFVGWYSTNSTSGTKLSGDASWTTSITSSGKTAYAVFEVDCTPPTFTAPSATSWCDGSPGTLTVSTKTSGSTIKWWESESSSTPLYSGDSYTPASFTATTTYYISATIDACTSARQSVTVTKIALPSLSLGLSPSTVYPWDVATITASTTCTTSTLDWKLYQGETLISTGAGSGTYYTFKKTDNTHYTLKGISSSGSGSSVTYTVKVDGNDGTCNAAQATQDITISAAASEDCGD